jgi:hypothetical protein
VIPRVWRAPLLVSAMLAMVWGIWMGLLRIGWAWPLPWSDQLILHGPLMIGGFLGTLIGLERAVGIAKPWAYAAPLLTAVGSMTLIAGGSAPFGALLITVGSAVVLVVFAVVVWREPSSFAITMALGAAAWLAGNAQWLGGAAIYRVVFWWMTFLVLTIAGERLELNRLLKPSWPIRASFIGAILVVCGGLLMSAFSPDAGVRGIGLGLVMLSSWLGAFDVARRTVRQSGLTRFMAVCLLAGYVWLGFGGLLALVIGASTSGLMYDAMLHAVFLGFVVSMIFGHAPIVFPAVLGTSMPFRPAFYLHLTLLHASLAIRVIGDLFEELGRWRAWGGALNAAAIGLFIFNSVPRIRQRTKAFAHR